MTAGWRALINADGQGRRLSTRTCQARRPRRSSSTTREAVPAGQHLAEAGHRRVLSWARPRRCSAPPRDFSGLPQTHARSSADVARSRVRRRIHRDFGRAAATTFLRNGCRPPRCSPARTRSPSGLSRCSAGKGCRFPGMFRSIGFDDVGPLNLFGPPLTAVRQPVAEIGRRGVELLLESNWQARIRRLPKSSAGRNHRADLRGPACGAETRNKKTHRGEGHMTLDQQTRYDRRRRCSALSRFLERPAARRRTTDLRAGADQPAGLVLQPDERRRPEGGRRGGRRSS